jgi:phage I-like protein
MRNYAMSVHEALANQGVTEQNGTAYWGAIDQEMRKRYPEQFGMKAPEPKQESTRPVAVTGATRTNGAPQAAPKNPRHVVLSESQVRIANSLGITPEDYAKEYVKYEAAAKGPVQ